MDDVNIVDKLKKIEIKFWELIEKRQKVNYGAEQQGLVELNKLGMNGKLIKEEVEKSENFLKD